MSKQGKVEKEKSFNVRRAERLVEEGNLYAIQGRIDEAIACYSESIKYHPTAESYTYLGKMLSFLSQFKDAIDLCKQAILIDPDFGNPYNDIGTYLMHQGENDEAIDWLKRAKVAPRYQERHFPFINLGQIYMAKGDYSQAIEEFEGALRIDPGNEEVRHLLSNLSKKAA